MEQTNRSGLSLYANLLDPANAASGSNADAAVASNQVDGRSTSASASATVDEAAKKQQALAASLRFQPTKRPQQSAAAAAAASAKAKAKAIASKLSAGAVAGGSAGDATSATSKTDDGRPAPSLATAPKTTAADWVATASDDEWNYGNDKRSRGGRKNKKRKAREAQLVALDWDDIYDPTRPNSYEEYKHSDEKVREVREWRQLLYRHRRRRSRERRMSSDEASDASDNSARPRPVSSMHRLFAPPPNLNSNNATAGTNTDDGNDNTDHSANSPPPPPPPPADVPDDATGDDAYARRLRMSQSQATSAATPAPAPAPAPPPPPGQISRAPVRYTLPPALPDDELESDIAKFVSVADGGGGGGGGGDNDNPDTADDENDNGRSTLPGQTGFAERLMAKYGWSKGQGLGAKGTGITSALYAKADKRKKKSDAEGGGFATPASMGKIMGGQKSKEAAAEEEGPFGAMSEVVRLAGMLDGIDLDAEMSADGGGIVQEIGDECTSKYGSVERVYIHRRQEADPVVFVQFVSALSALRAVNALDGRMFGGNTINARFWSKDSFLADEYE